MNRKTFTLNVLPGRFGICRLDASASVPDLTNRSLFFSITRTADELSLVCNEAYLPKEHPCDYGWKCIKVKGPLDFSETGILSSLTGLLAEAEVAIFVLSTYETDYLLVKEKDLTQAIKALASEGHSVVYEDISNFS